VVEMQKRKERDDAGDVSGMDGVVASAYPHGGQSESIRHVRIRGARRGKEGCCYRIRTRTTPFVARLLASAPFRIACMVWSSSLLILGLYFAQNVENGLDAQLLLPDSSNYVKYEKTLAVLFPSIGIPVEVVTDGAIDYTDDESWPVLYNILRSLKASRWVEKRDITATQLPPSSKSWALDYSEWMVGRKGTVNEYPISARCASFQSFVRASFGYQGKLNVKGTYVGDDGLTLCPRITSSVFLSDYLIPLPNSSSQMEAMIAMRSVADALNDGREGLAGWERAKTSWASNVTFHVYSPGFLFFEQYVDILPTATRSFLGAVAAIAVVTIVFLRSTRYGIAVVLNMLTINSNVLALMALSGIQINAMTVPIVVMATGLSVDYSAHVAHVFKESSKQLREEILSSGKTQRVEDAKMRKATAEAFRQTLDSVGAAVMKGAFSSILSVFFTFFATSLSLRTVAILLTYVVVLSVLHTFTTFPALLQTIIGPPATRAEREQRERAVVVSVTYGKVAKGERGANSMSQSQLVKGGES